MKKIVGWGQVFDECSYMGIWCGLRMGVKAFIGRFHTKEK
jgi:hypothetical protein